jgi:uncharacterized protein
MGTSAVVTLTSEIAGRMLRLPQPQTRDLDVERDLPVAMDDGVVLLADRYAPRGAGPGPTVLIRSPYGRRFWIGLMFGRLLAERGLQVVVQSVRGTFGSGGEFDPFDERDDGLATLRWLREQPWHDGPVGTTGPSYMGIVQWAVADELDAMSLAVTASQFRGQSYGSGTLSLDTALSWLLVLEVQERRFGPLLLMRGLHRTLPGVYDRLPLRELDRIAFGRESPIWRRWMDELAPESPWWAQRDFSSGVADVEAPVQLVAGWHDIFLPWQIEDFQALKQAGRPPQLVIGPWAHMSPGLASHGLREALGWLRAHLLGDRRRVRDTPVRVWVGGEERWRDLPDWPPPGAAEHTLYLQPGGSLAPTAPEGASPPDRFRYDPADPTPAVGGPVLMDQQPVRDNRALEARPDVLTYTTTPMLADTELIGPVSATVHLRSSLEHTDVFVRLCDVQPDGRSLNVCDALVRLTPDAPPRDADGVARVELPLWPTAHRLRRGHRLRVQVSSGAHPRYARNPGTGEPPATATRLVAADQEVFHDAERPSSVTVSILRS